jgi:hypothetical protein
MTWSAFARSVPRRGPDTAPRCITLTKRDRVQQHTRTPNNKNKIKRKKVLMAGSDAAPGRTGGYSSGRKRVTRTSRPNRRHLLLFMLLTPPFLLLLPLLLWLFRRCLIRLAFSSLTQTLTTPLPVGLGRGSPNLPTY